MRIIFFILIGLVFVGGIMLVMLGFYNSEKTTISSTHSDGTGGENVSIEDGKQIIVIRAKGGYAPQMSIAQAGIPTVIKFETDGTFDCSSAVSIPALGYHALLSPSGETIVNVPPQLSDTKLIGSCSMGMYNFSIIFK